MTEASKSAEMGRKRRNITFFDYTDPFSSATPEIACRLL
jgi:hypothetical protein